MAGGGPGALRSPLRSSALGMGSWRGCYIIGYIVCEKCMKRGTRERSFARGIISYSVLTIRNVLFSGPIGSVLIVYGMRSGLLLGLL